MKRTVAVLLTVATAAALTACSLDSQPQSANTVTVVIGYQSKTINTVTAGTLLKAKGFLEKRLADVGKAKGVTYDVQWQDYDTGAPITAQMVAEKIDIGSMGDYPLLINGSKTQAAERARTELISVTGYSPTGSLNMVVVAPNSPASTITDLKGQKVSASVGSAGHGTLVRALDNAGVDPKSSVEVLNQQPQVGASALESGQAQALSQFVAWPGLLVFQGKAKLLYDGAEGNYPTWHGVVIRRDYAKAHPEVADAFLQAQLDATDYLNAHPLESSKLVADGSGLPQEVVYLYNGPGGASFDATLKPALVQALKGDVPYLKTIGDFAELNVDGFVDDTLIRKAFADRHADYDAARNDTTNPSPIRGRDPVGGVVVTDPKLAGEVWIDGKDTTQPAANPASLLKAIREATARGERVRVAYVPDTEFGTRWFADKSLWVRVRGERGDATSAGANYLPFATTSGAQRYVTAHPGAVVVDYQQALAGAV